MVYSTKLIPDQSSVTVFPHCAADIPLVPKNQVDGSIFDATGFDTAPVLSLMPKSGNGQGKIQTITPTLLVGSATGLIMSLEAADIDGIANTSNSPNYDACLYSKTSGGSEIISWIGTLQIRSNTALSTVT